MPNKVVITGICPVSASCFSSSLAPDMITVRIELRYKDVGTTCARESVTAEVYSAAEISRDHDVARTVHGDASSYLAARIAEALAPDVIAVRIELHHVDVRISCARKSIAAEIYGAGEATRDDDVSRAIHGHTVAELVIRIAKVLAPDVVAV